MRYMYLVLAVIFLQGCASMTVEQSGTSGLMGGKQEPFSAISKIKEGITESELKALMGDSLVIGYSVNTQNPGTSQAAKVKNPYREEEFKKQDRTYKIFYYFTQIKKTDGIVADDELTPVVVNDGKVVGIGANFVHQLKNI